MARVKSMQFKLYVVYNEIAGETVIRMLKIPKEKFKGLTAGKKIRSWDEYTQ